MTPPALAASRGHFICGLAGDYSSPEGEQITIGPWGISLKSQEASFSKAPRKRPLTAPCSKLADESCDRSHHRAESFLREGTMCTV